MNVQPVNGAEAGGSGSANSGGSPSSSTKPALSPRCRPSLPSFPPTEADPPTSVDLGALPREYLDAYPYPAFVLVAPVPPRRIEHPRAVPTSPQTNRWTLPLVLQAAPDKLVPVWTNAHWARLAAGRTLAACLSPDGVRRLAAWLRDTTVDGEEQAGGLADLAPTLTLEFDFDGNATLLELTKVSIPLYVRRRGERTMVDTHTFAVITTHLRSAVSTPPETDTQTETEPIPRIPITPLAGLGVGVGVHTRAEAEEDGQEELAEEQGPEGPEGPAPLPADPSPEPEVRSPSKFRTPFVPTPSRLVLPRQRPLVPYADAGRLVDTTTPPLRQYLFFARDGSVRRSPAPPREASGRSLVGVPVFGNVDWAKTPVGPEEQWDERLCLLLEHQNALPTSSALWWGEDFTFFYNQAYAEQLEHHPKAFGTSGAAAWAELWTAIGPLTELVLKGTSIFKEDDLVMLKDAGRSGFFESYRSQMFAPLRLSDGSFGGVSQWAVETTKRVLDERRNGLIRDLAEGAAHVRSVEDFNSIVLDVLEEHPRDVPFALLYTVDPQNQAMSATRRQTVNPTYSESPPRTRAKLWQVGSVGVPTNHASAPRSMDVSVPPPGDPADVMLAVAFSNPALKGSSQTSPTPSSLRRSLSSHGISSMASVSVSSSGYTHSQRSNTRSNSLEHSKSDFGVPPSEVGAAGTPVGGTEEGWPFLLALHSRRPVLVEDCSALIAGYPVRVWDELPKSAIVIPITTTPGKDLPSEVLVLGLSSRLHFDEAYKAFIHLLASQLGTHLAAVRASRSDQMRIEELGTLDRAKSALFSNVAQELFVPLALVPGPLDDAISDMPPGAHREGLVIARRNVRRLTRLVGILRDISNLEAGQFRGKFQLVNLGELTRDGAALFRKAASKAHLEFTVDCDTTPHEAYVDRSQWDKILFTLVENAISYTIEGSVHVSLSYEGNQAVLDVTDTGVGIPAADVKHVGERFYRGDQAHTRHDGSGVMLSFVKKLVEMHKGGLKVESRCATEVPPGEPHSVDGYGAEAPRETEWRYSAADMVDDSDSPALGLSLIPTPGAWAGTSPPKTFQEGGSAPVPAAPNGIDVAVPRSPGEKPAPSIGILPRIHGAHTSTLWFDPSDVIMIVDDLHDTRRYLRSILEPFCKVVEARDGVEALEKFDEAAPDLVVADITLPRMNGIELLQRLRAGSHNQRIVPFLLLTSPDDARPEAAFQADDMLSKPFNARELVAVANLQVQVGKKRRNMERLFEERTQELRVVTDSSPVGIFRCTEDGYVMYANQAWYDHVGYPADAEVTNWGDYVREEDQARIRGVWEEFITSDAPSASAEWQWKNGRSVFTKVIRLDAKVGDGKPRGSIGCCIDITDRILHENLQKQRLQEAEQRRADAEEAKFQQELLIDITSHEIRNPISSLMQCSSLVKTNLWALQEQLQDSFESGQPFQPTQQLLLTMSEDLEALDSIYECGLTQERISNDVLSLGKIQLDMMQLFDADASIAREAHKIVSVFQNEARMKRIELMLDVSPTFEQLGIYSVKTDHVRLGQIMTNLLTNAIRFTANSPVRRIQLRVDVGLDPPVEGSCAKPAAGLKTSRAEKTHLAVREDTPVYIFIAVRDTGPGLTSHELEQLFQRFSQASPKTHIMYGGSGLGLFVCRKLAELLGGRIDVASTPGKGSEFSFFVTARAGAFGPNTPATNTPAVGSRPTSAARAHPAAAFTRDHFAKARTPHILVVEDNLINRKVLIRQLRHVGMHVDAAHDGQEALSKIQRAMVPRTQPWDNCTCDEEHLADEDGDAAADGMVSNTRATSANGATTEHRPYDLVLMDLEMPVMDGYTAAQRVRAEEAAGRLDPSIIIALTGNARQVQIDAAMADFDDVVIKPYRLDDLLKRMEGMLRRLDTEGQHAHVHGHTQSPIMPSHVRRMTG